MTGIHVTRLISALAGILLLALGACAPAQNPAADTDTPPKSFVIFFQTDSAELTAQGMEVIDRVVDEVQRVHATGVGISGYSGSTGAPAVNLRLSEQRMAAVETALALRQVPRAIIVSTYHGATDVTGPQIEGQRVEIVVSRAN
jgi:outer membrane protein OmpA-like peptidoglycan-associated protein